MDTNWTWPCPHREYIRRKLDIIRDYLDLCDVQDMPPLRCTVGLLARKIREYRAENHFYDCV